MTEEAQADDSRSLGQTLGRLNVGVARVGISTRMVVSQCESTTIAAQHGVKDLADRNRSEIHRALRHNDGSQRTVCSVAGDDEHMLTPQASELSLGDRRDIGRSMDDDGRLT